MSTDWDNYTGEDYSRDDVQNYARSLEAQYPGLSVSITDENAGVRVEVTHGGNSSIDGIYWGVLDKSSNREDDIKNVVLNCVNAVV